MEVLLGIIIVLGIVVFIISGCISGLIALSRANNLKVYIKWMKNRLMNLSKRLTALENILKDKIPVAFTGKPEEFVTPVPSPPIAEKKVKIIPEKQTVVQGTEPELSSPPPGQWWVKFDEKIAKCWLAWAGVLVLFFSAGFFVKYAIDQWIGPTGRVVLAIIAGMILLMLGDRFTRRRMRALGQSLMGGSLAILYVALFAAFSFYHLIPQSIAFIAMIIVTASGMMLGVLHNAVAISFIAALGGFLTPMMVSTGEDPRDVLFSYILLLDLGILGVAFFRRWRTLDFLSFIGTFIIFSGWFHEFYRERYLVPTLLWLAVFFLVFLILPFAYHLRRKTPTTLERFIMELVNATIVFGYAYHMLFKDYRDILGFVALALSACYIGMGSLARRRIPTDTNMLFGFVSLAVVFITMAVPLHLKLYGITLAWLVEGPALLYLGYRYRYFPVRAMGFIVLVIAVIRFFVCHWPLHHDLFVIIWNKSFLTAMLVPLAATIYASIHQVWKKGATEADVALKIISAIGAGFLMLIILSGEIDQHFSFIHHKLWHEDYASLCTISLLWTFGAICFLGAGILAKSSASRYAGLVPFIGVFAFLVSAFDIDLKEYFVFLNLRFFAGLCAVLMLFLYAYVLRSSVEVITDQERRMAKYILWSSGFFLLLLLSTETYNHSIDTIIDHRKAGWSAQMSLSMIWSVYAVATLALGFWRRNRRIRLAALTLFGVTTLKLLFVDMANVAQVYRIISFFTVGVLLVGASYLYYKVEKRLEGISGDKS